MFAALVDGDTNVALELKMYFVTLAVVLDEVCHSFVAKKVAEKLGEVARGGTCVQRGRAQLIKK